MKNLLFLVVLIYNYTTGRVGRSPGCPTIEGVAVFPTAQSVPGTRGSAEWRDDAP